VKSGAVWLAERLVMWKGGAYSAADRDIVVSISIGGRELYRDKAKYDDAANLVVENDDMAFVVNVLYPPA